MEFKLRGLRGVPALLVAGLALTLILGLLALLVFLGAAVAVAGLAVSTVAALYYAVRRKLSGQSAATTVRTPAVQQGNVQITEVREIEVEVLPRRD